MNNSKTLILIDGHALAYRSYFALERTGMKTKSGQPTWAIYGFFTALFDLLKKVKPDAMAVSFDMGRHTFRTEVFQEYKANRESMPDNLRSQMEFLHEGLKAMDIPIYQLQNYEADDIIGTIAYKAKALGHKTFILTGDRDSFQLIDNEGDIKVLIPSKGLLEEYDKARVFDRMGVYPEQIVDFKALSGDSSDNIPGIKGIGAKTACKLLSDYQNLENILKNIQNIKGESLKKKLSEGIEIAKKSQYLAQIDKNTPIEFDFEKTELTPLDTHKIGEFFQKMEFLSLMRQIPKLQLHFKIQDEIKEKIDNKTLEERPTQGQLSLFGESLPDLPQFEYKIIQKEKDFEEFLEKLTKTSVFALDTETTSVQAHNTNLVGLSISFDENFSFQNGELLIKDGAQNIENYYIPLSHLEGEQLDIDIVLSKLKPIFENPEYGKILQNAKFDLNVLKSQNIDLKNIVLDTMLASYLTDPTRKHGLKQQAFSLIGLNMAPIEEIIGKGKNALTMDKIDIEKAGHYAALDSFATLELGKFYAKKLDKNLKKLLYEIEIPLVFVLAYMERIGVHIDTEYLNELSKETERNLQILEAKIYEQAGQIFNINSPKQVGDILFEKMMLPSGKKTKTGYSTSSDILENLAKDYEIARLILEQRHLSKIKSTYMDALPLLVCQDKRIHASFNQAITTTGRLSSSNPNLQNIPIRTELGNRIRAAFTPQEADSVILSADYSQIELRLLAHFSEDENLVNAFLNNIDIHTATASSVFGVDIKDVTKEMRYKAKAVNFGIIYGQTSYGLSTSINTTPTEAKAFIDKYFKTYPKIKEYLDKTIEIAHKQGYIETMYGRKRYLKEELESSNRMIKEFAERAAVNAPLQGTAADLIKLAMIEVYKKLQEKNLKTKMIIQVHDELVLEVPKNELEEVKILVKKAMELGQPLKVPLDVDIQTGKSWMEFD